MHITFVPTKLSGGVTIKGDANSIGKVERLLARTAIESHIDDNDGLCMTLSRYFEGRSKPVDWVTLVAGVSALRTSLGYRLSRERHAVMCLLEHEINEALCKTLKHIPRDTIEHTLDDLIGISDRSEGSLIDSRVTYLYLLKTPEARKAELLKILQSFSPTLKYLDRGYSERFKGLKSCQLSYPAGTEFQYPL